MLSGMELMGIAEKSSWGLERPAGTVEDEVGRTRLAQAPVFRSFAS